MTGVADTRFVFLRIIAQVMNIIHAIKILKIIIKTTFRGPEAL